MHRISRKGATKYLYRRGEVIREGGIYKVRRHLYLRGYYYFGGGGGGEMWGEGVVIVGRSVKYRKMLYNDNYLHTCTLYKHWP